MTENIPFFHGWNVSVVKMQIRAADGRRCNLDDGIARVEYLWVGYVLNLYLVYVIPAKSFHVNLLFLGPGYLSPRQGGRKGCLLASSAPGSGGPDRVATTSLAGARDN